MVELCIPLKFCFCGFLEHLASFFDYIVIIACPSHLTPDKVWVYGRTSSAVCAFEAVSVAHFASPFASANSHDYFILSKARAGSSTASTRTLAGSFSGLNHVSHIMITA